MIRRGSPATKSAAEAANTTGRTGPMFSAQAIIAPTYQPVTDQRAAAKARFFIPGLSSGQTPLPMELWYSPPPPIGLSAYRQVAATHQWKGHLQGRSGSITSTFVLPVPSHW